MNIIHSVANFCLERCWLEAGGSTESVITATAALRSSTTPTNNRRSFQSLSALLPAQSVHNRAQQRHCESDASDEKIQKTSLLQYDKIRWDWEAFRSASTALSLCRAWKHCCLRDSSAPPKEQAKRRVQEGSQRSKIGNYTQ